jgi:hypothetical protein
VTTKLLGVTCGDEIANSKKGDILMRPSRLGCRPTVAVMLMAALLFAGGALLGTAGPASAATGGTNVCSTLSATVDLSAAVPMVTGTLSGCHQQGSGAWSAVATTRPGSTPGSIAWRTGHATSNFVITTVAVDFTGGPCPAGDVAADFTIAVTSGPYEGSQGALVECVDISHYPTSLTITNFGSITI